MYIYIITLSLTENVLWRNILWRLVYIAVEEYFNSIFLLSYTYDMNLDFPCLALISSYSIESNSLLFITYRRGFSVCFLFVSFLPLGQIWPGGVLLS